MIAKKPTTALYALLIVVCITVFAIGCTFTAAEETEETTAQETVQTEPTEPTQTTEETVPEEEPVDDGILLGKIEVLLGEHIRQNYGEDAAFTAKTVREMEEWFNHHLCRTDYRLTVQGQTQEGSMYTLWYEDPYAEDGTFLLQEQDFDGSMLSPEWWQERYPMGDVTWQPEEVSFYGGSNFDFVTQLSDEHELYCGHRGNVYDHYMNRMRMMFPDGDVGIFLYDNVPVDLGREEGYYVYRLEYYLGREGTIYQLRNYTVYRFRDKPVSGNVWEFFAILSDEDLRGYGIDPDTIKEAEPAPYEDHCR